MEKIKTGLNQAKDTALAVVLICLIVLALTKDYRYGYPAMIALVAAMIRPGVYRWPAVIWFGFSHCLGTIVSKVILSIVFILVATPVGLARRAGGADPMRRKSWKKNGETAFVSRNHRFSKEDIEKPY